LDNSMMQQNLFPPAPSVQSSTVQSNSIMDSFLPSKNAPSKNAPSKSTPDYGFAQPVLAANSLLGGSFGSAF